MVERSPVRQAIDPEATLPVVDLVPEPDKVAPKGTLVPHRMLIVEPDDGMVIGRATIVANSNQQTEHFNGIELFDEYRGQGFGMATYLTAVEAAHGRGREFRSHDWTQTEAAAKVWGKFIAAGVAEVVAPITYSHTEEDGVRKFTSDVRIKP